jgi:hypothetical protein
VMYALLPSGLEVFPFSESTTPVPELVEQSLELAEFCQEAPPPRFAL